MKVFNRTGWPVSIMLLCDGEPPQEIVLKPIEEKDLQLEKTITRIETISIEHIDLRNNE